MKALPFAAAILAALAAAGCETSNQDYSSSPRVVDVTARPGAGDYGYSAPAPAPAPAPVQSAQAALPPDSAVSEPSQVTYSYAGVPEASTASPAQAPVYTPAPAPAQTVQPYTPAPAPVYAPGDTYTVVKGDTLYSIAFRYGLDFRALARSNGIEPPYNIAVGQVIQLNRQASAAPTYTVKPGDTLYSIARNNGQSVPFLAGVNNLEPPYTLSVGQVLYLARADATTSANRAVEQDVPVAGEPKPAAVPAPAPAPAKPSTSQTPVSTAQVSSSADSTAPAAESTPSTTTVLTDPVVVPGSTRTVGGVTWQWPVKGTIIESFSTAEQGNKGIDIAGNRGQQVLAAADGQVVYAGNALRGYGNLIIINHANEYLSAYAHNEVLQVTEGQSVKRGQQIARMGSTDAKSVRLHFEIRYRGQSVNPISYLPK